MLLVTALLALAVAACGGGGGDKATSSTDVNQLLKETFSQGKTPKSGKLHVALKIGGNATGAASGPVSVTLDGPFESQGTGKLPKFDMDASLSGAGQNFKAGATSTGEKGFLSFQGQEYAVSDQVFKQFKASYEQAIKQGTSKQSQRQSLAALGINPSAWLKNPKNEGEAKVGDTDTIKITGTVDVNRMLDDLSKATSQARALGIQGFENVPSQLTPEQRKQVAEQVKNVSAEIYTGKADTIMRRMHVKLDLQNKGQTANVDFDFSYADVNEGQDIKSPSNAKPFEQLISQLQGLSGRLGGGSGSGSSGSSGGSNADDFKKYSDCVAKAGNDAAKAQKCADLLK
jgi:hypothetical protein